MHLFYRGGICIFLFYFTHDSMKIYGASKYSRFPIQKIYYFKILKSKCHKNEYF